MNRDARTRQVLFNLHLIGGLVAGLFLLILGVSGAVLAFSDEIDAFLQPSVFKVTPQARQLPATQLVANAAAVLHPGDIITVYVPSVRPDRSDWFTVIPSHRRLPRQVFVNQYTGKVLGNLSVVRFTVIMKTLHNVMAFSTIILLFLAPSGLYLWWPLKRIGIKSSAGFSAPLIRSSQLPWVLFLTFHARFCRHRCVYGARTMDGARDYCDDSKQTGVANRGFPAEGRGSTHLRRSRVFCCAERVTWGVDTLGFHPS